MGPELQELLSFTAGMDAQTRGLAVTSADWLRAAHNALSPPSAISLDGLELPKTSEDAYHFIVYLPVLGSLYELDGLKQAPITHGLCGESGEGWVARARYTSPPHLLCVPAKTLITSLEGSSKLGLPRIHQARFVTPSFLACGGSLGGYSWNSISSHSVMIPCQRYKNNSLRHRHPETASGKLTLPRGLQTNTQNVTDGPCVFLSHFSLPTSSHIVDPQVREQSSPA